MEGNLFVGGTNVVNIGIFPRGTRVELDHHGQSAPGIFLKKTNGRFDPDAVFGMVDRRLHEMASTLKSFHS